MKYKRQNKAGAGTEGQKNTGYLDSLVITAEQLASYVIRKNKPPHVTLERIANLAEKAMKHQLTRAEFRTGKLVLDNRGNRQEMHENGENTHTAVHFASFAVIRDDTAQIGEPVTFWQCDLVRFSAMCSAI